MFKEVMLIRDRTKFAIDAIQYCEYQIDSMYPYVAIITLLFAVGQKLVNAPPPVRLTIDCGSEENDASYGILKSNSANRFSGKSHFDVNSFCDLIHNAIPKAVKDGKFVLIEPYADQNVFADTQTAISIAPPQTFVPKLPHIKRPKLKIPKINVPKLKSPSNVFSKPPIVGSPMSLSIYRSSTREETSAERMEKFKKGIQKMLHVVKVLGQVDQYISERTKIIIDKLSKTFAD